MKDIDFDELDKAVTSLMGGIGNMPETGRPDDDIKTLVIKPSQPMPGATDVAATKPEEAQPLVKDEASDSAPQETPGEPAAPSASASVVPSRPAPMSNRPAPSLATRRAGRFMDVMHPSSDMAKSTSTPPVSRHAGQIEPLSAVVAPEPVVASAPAPSPVSIETTSIEPAAASEWPDPLDMLPTEATHEDTSIAGEDVAAEPLVSPFLPDAKVEKRPLGGFAPEVTEQDDGEVEPATQDIQVQPSLETATLPEELQGDLMAIESGQADVPVAVAAEVEPVLTTPTPAVTPTPISAPQAQPAGPASIPQQYKEVPSTGDQTNGAIYDTDAYHQALHPPVKKKQNWIWIVWIAALLLIGAGGGAAAYLYLLK